MVIWYFRFRERSYDAKGFTAGWAKVATKLSEKMMTAFMFPIDQRDLDDIRN